MKNISFVSTFVMLCLCMSCQEAVNIKPEVEKIEIDLKLVRFDSIFAASKPQDLKQLQKDYPFMFRSSISDSLWQQKMQDTLQKEIEREVFKVYSDFSSYEKDIELFFKHLKYFFPKQQIPEVITLAQYVDYKSKAFLNGDMLYISLDNYLGKDHPFYEGFQQYISSLQAPHQILPDIAEQYANRLVPLPQSRDFLSQLVYEGKKIYFKQQTLPLAEPHHLIGYSQAELDWADEYEFMVWQYFVERNLLYSTKSDLRRRFLAPAPFTKFYLEVDSESPPRLGQFIGWEIVRAYAGQFPQKSLEEIINTDPQKLFNQSKYKP